MIHNNNTDCDNNLSSPRDTIDGLNNSVSIKLERVTSKLAALSKLCTELSTMCATIKALSTELQEMTDSSAEMNPTHRYLGEETHHLVDEAEDLDNAKKKYVDALAFMEDCVSLRCNDTRKTTSLSAWIRSNTSGKVLSDCLRYNTNISKLSLHLDAIYEYDDDDDAEMMRQNI